MASAEDTSSGSRYWVTLLARAVPLALLAAVITFSADHSSRLGLLAFGSFALVNGALLVWLGLRMTGNGENRWSVLGQAVLGLVAGVGALVGHSGGTVYFFGVLAAWAATTGLMELIAGLQARGRHAAARDWMFIGALTAILALVALAVPVDYTQQYTGPDDVARVLDAPVVLVGALGAYGAIAAVYLVIAGLTLKWAPASTSIKSPAKDGTRL